jgi:threonine synthase
VAEPPVSRVEPLAPTNGEAGEEARYTIPPVLLVDSTKVLPGELGAERTIASDPARGVDERLEALENIFDSEIGDTTLARSRNVEREVGIRQLFLKFEGSNATGTQKDRIAFAQASDALRRGFVSVTAATCGNYGVAMALAAMCAGLECFMYIPRGYSSRRIEEMERLGTKIVREGEDYEGAVAASRARAERDDIYDANPGGANTALQLKAYGEIAYEIYDQLRDAPAIVAVPVSNGTTLAGIYRGFLSLYRRGRTSRMPRMVAGSSYRKNPIVHSFLKGSTTYEDLDPKAIRETETNEPLINWHSAEGEDALDALRATNGAAAYATDKNLKAISRLVREKEGLSVLPAAAAGLIALIEMHEKSPFPNDRYVAVLTGRK